MFGNSSVAANAQTEREGECAEHPVDVGFERALERHLSSIVYHRSDAFRRPLPQIGGANIAGADRAWQPLTSSSLGDEKRVPSLLLSRASRDPVSAKRQDAWPGCVIIQQWL